MKKNFYLQHSLMTMNDPRMKTLIAEEGLGGFGAYWFILEKLELLPEPYAQIEYLQPFCSKQIPLLYIGKIICKYQLFIIDEEGNFTPAELNPSRNKDKKTISNEQDLAQKQALNAQNIAKFEEKLRFFARKSTRTAHKNNSKSTAKIQENSVLSKNNSTNTKENIKDKIITATAEEKKETAAADAVDFSSEILVEKRPAQPTPPNRSWSQMVDDLVQEEHWLKLTYEQSGYESLLRRNVKKAIELFKKHIELYNKGEKLKTKNDVRIYFIHFISAGSPTSIRLRDALKQWDSTVNASTQKADDNPYRYEQRIDGRRTYMGCPIPSYAPPRPGEKAIWNDQTRSWTSPAQTTKNGCEKSPYRFLQ